MDHVNFFNPAFALNYSGWTITQAYEETGDPPYTSPFVAVDSINYGVAKNLLNPLGYPLYGSNFALLARRITIDAADELLSLSVDLASQTYKWHVATGEDYHDIVMVDFAYKVIVAVDASLTFEAALRLKDAGGTVSSQSVYSLSKTVGVHRYSLPHYCLDGHGGAAGGATNETPLSLSLNISVTGTGTYEDVDIDWVCVAGIYVFERQPISQIFA